MLAGTSTLFGDLNVAEGTVTAQNSSALGLAGGIGATVSDGATLVVQGGISLPATVTLSGYGVRRQWGVAEASKGRTL